MPNLTEEQLAGQVAAFHTQLTEATLNFYSDLGVLDYRDLYDDAYNFSGGGSAYGGWYFPRHYRSRKRGEVIPVALSSEHLRQIRDRSRRLAANNEFAISGTENRKNYIIGEGLTYRASKREGYDCPDGLVKRVQDIIDLFAEANSLAEVELDVVQRCDEDGEAFLRLFPQPSGIIDVRTVEPEHVESPQGDGYDDQYSFGVETEPGDVERIQAYWIIEEPTRQPSPVRVSEREVIHFKANVKRNAKRGLPLHYAVESNLRRAEDLLASMTSMAKTRAKIALIRKFSGTAKSAVQDFVDNLKDATGTDGATGRVNSLEKLAYGTILNSSGNIDYEMPTAGGSVGTSDLVGVLDAELRAVASRYVQPPWMLFQQTSDANYASALVGEAPAVKNFQRLQRYFGKRFGECRIPGSNMSLIWRQLRHAVRVGLLPPEVIQCIEIQVEAPSLVVRDTQAEATTNKTYNDMGVKSVQTIQQELNLDTDQEQENFKKILNAAMQQQQQADQQQSQMGGMLGGDGLGEVTPDFGEDRPKGLSEALLESRFARFMETGGYTGEVTDSLGRTYHYVDGKRQKKTDAQGKEEVSKTPIAKEKLTSKGKSLPSFLVDQHGKEHYRGTNSFNDALGELVSQRVEDAQVVFSHKINELIDEEGIDDDKAIAIAEEGYNYAAKHINALVRQGVYGLHKNYGDELKTRAADSVREFVEKGKAAKSKLEDLYFGVSGHFEDALGGHFDDEDGDVSDDFHDAVTYSLSELKETSSDVVNELWDELNGIGEEIQGQIEAEEEEAEAEAEQWVDELNGEHYEDDPESAWEDGAHNNQLMRDSGNMHRVWRDDDGTWYYDWVEDMADTDYPGKEHDKHLFESLLESGFSGTVKDKLGREFHYVNGKRVKKDRPSNSTLVRKMPGGKGKDSPKRSAIKKAVAIAMKTSPPAVAAKHIATKAGFSERTSEVLGVIAAIGDWSAPGVPAGSAVVILGALLRKPSVAIEVTSDMLKAARKLVRGVALRVAGAFHESLQESEVDESLTVEMGQWLESAENPAWAVAVLAASMEEAGGDPTKGFELAQTAMEQPSQELSEALIEAVLLEAGFTGVRKDKLGREMYYQDGKRIPNPNKKKSAKKPQEKKPTKKEQKAQAKAELAQHVKKAKSVLSRVTKGENVSAEDLVHFASYADKLTVPELKDALRDMKAKGYSRLAKAALQSEVLRTYKPKGETKTPTKEQPKSETQTQTLPSGGVKQAAFEEFQELLNEKHSHTKLVPIHEVRELIRQKYGDKAARHEAFDDEIRQLRRDGKIKIIPLSDLSRATSEQLNDSIPGIDETLYYMEPKLG